MNSALHSAISGPLANVPQNVIDMPRETIRLDDDLLQQLSNALESGTPFPDELLNRFVDLYVQWSKTGFFGEEVLQIFLNSFREILVEVDRERFDTKLRAKIALPPGG